MDCCVSHYPSTWFTSLYLQAVRSYLSFLYPLNVTWSLTNCKNLFPYSEYFFQVYSAVKGVTVTNTYFVSIPRLSINLMTSVMHTAVVEKYRSPDEMVLVYRSDTVYVAATSVITVRQYSLKATLTFSEERQDENALSHNGNYRQKHFSVSKLHI